MSKISTRRILALFIDNAFVSIIITVLSSIINFSILKALDFEILGRNFSMSTHLVVLILYFIFFDLFKKGNTLGKSILNLSVKSNEPNFNQITLLKRTFLKFIFFNSPLALFLLGYYIAKETVFYDFVVKTKVE